MDFKRKSVSLPVEIIEMAERYQRSCGLKSFSQAVLELLVAGLYADNARVFEHLKDEYYKWENDRHAHGNTYDPLTDQERGYSFQRFVQERYSPAWGGKREGAGRPSQDR